MTATDTTSPALLARATVVRMRAGNPVPGWVVECWPVHPGTERMVALHDEWVRAHLAHPTAKVKWADGETTLERVTDLRTV